MLPDKQTNSNPAKQSSTFMETLQDKLKDIKNFSNWSTKEQMVAVTAVGVIFGALLPVVAVALPVAATGAAVALTLFFAVKAVEYGYKGLKRSAKETWEGAKYVGGKVKDGAVRAKDSVKETASFMRQATREGTSSALQKVGNKMSNLGRSMSSLDGIPYSIESHSQTVVLRTEEKTKNFNSIKEMFIKEVFEDKAVNSSALTKEIFSELRGKILEKAYSVDGQQGFKKDQLINQLGQQADFVSKLNAKKLQKLLAQDDNNLYEIFSEHHNEIKGIIEKCKTEHTIDNLSRSSSMSSLNSNSTINSTTGLLNSKERKEAPTFLLDRSTSPFKSGEKSEQTSKIKYQPLFESDAMPSAKIGNSRFYVAPQKPPRSNSPSHVTGNTTPDLDPKDLATTGRKSSGDQPIPGAPSKVPESPTSDYGSKRSSPLSSGYSTPERQSFSMKDVEDGNPQAKLRRMNSPYKSEQPSTRVFRQKFEKVNPPYYREPTLS